MNTPIITRGVDGEYSTVEIHSGIIETMWFPDDVTKPAVFVGRTYMPTPKEAAKTHIAAFETGRNEK